MMTMQTGNYVEGMSRGQVILLPDTLDDYVDEANEVRFIDAFVDALDLIELDFTHSEPSDEGRPPYDPKDMLKLYIWGYLNQVRSSRKLERECHRNLEVMWTMKKLAPDFKTIADFRKDNVDCIKKVFKEFVNFLQDLDLFGGELASIDGSKFKAVNATKRNFDAKKLAHRIKRIEEKIERYVRELEEGDRTEEREAAEERALLPKRREYLKEKLEKLRKQTEELKAASEKLKESGQEQISLTDPDSRLMKNNGKFEVCYNVQASVDEKNKLIADYDATNEGEDRNQLSKMAKGAKETLRVDELEVTADRGFSNSLGTKECIDDGITPYVPEQKAGGRYRHTGIPEPAFHKDKFVYSAESDTYMCPAGNEMSFWKTDSDAAGRLMRVYRTDACNGCPFRRMCTNNRLGRTIRRWEHEQIIEEMRERLKRAPMKAAIRKDLSEHPFGTMKRAFNQGYLLLKGLRKVIGEVGFTMLAYNMRRAISILGSKALLASLGQ